MQRDRFKKLDISANKHKPAKLIDTVNLMADAANKGRTPNFEQKSIQHHEQVSSQDLPNKHSQNFAQFPLQGSKRRVSQGQTKGSLSNDLTANETLLRKEFESTADVVFYSFVLFDNRRALLVYVEGLVDSQHVARDILLPLTKSKTGGYEESLPTFSIGQLAEEFITLAERHFAQTVADVIQLVVEGMVVLLIDGETKVLALSAVKRRDRGIAEPDTEALIRGPREGFIENIATNISLVRRRLPTNELKVESLKIGRYTKTEVALCYLQDLANPALVDEMRKRLIQIDIDGVIDAGYLEELVEDSPFSPFPQIQNSERPDVVVAALLEGKVAVLTDGSPFSLIAPINLWAALQAAEDYYERYMIVSLIRWLRYLFLILALFLPSLYVAITTFHQEMLPTKLLLSVAAAREVTPLPAMVEALLMEITFEALREAGVRLPKAVGSAISIVGALVIGQAAVQAGMASAPMVIIVSITGIASFTIPRYNFAIAIRMLRFPMIILAGTLGLFGIVIGLIAITIHLSQLRSFGVPYLYPLSPFSKAGLKDTLVRVPRWAMGVRPLQMNKRNPRRQSRNMKPGKRIPDTGPT